LAPVSHINPDERATMDDVGLKASPRHFAQARGTILLSQATCDLIRSSRIAKGSVLTVAQVAGIQAAKRTSELIPLCHAMSLEHVDVTLELADAEVIATAGVSSMGRHGVEMEALTAVTVALLTVYDMCKAVDKQMEIGPIAIVEQEMSAR